MKKIMIMAVVLMMSINFALAVTRSVTDNRITYTVDHANWGSSISKSYWAVEDTLIGCSPNTVSPTTDNCGSGSADWRCEYSLLGDVIRAVVFPPDDGLHILSSVINIDVEGTGACSLTGDYVESPGISGVETSITGTSIISLSEPICSIAGDTYPACDGIDRSELGVLAQAWIVAGGPSGALRTDLGIAAQNWIDNGGPA